MCIDSTNNMTDMNLCDWKLLNLEKKSQKKNKMNYPILMIFFGVLFMKFRILKSNSGKILQIFSGYLTPCNYEEIFDNKNKQRTTFRSLMLELFYCNRTTYWKGLLWLSPPE